MNPFEGSLGIFDSGVGGLTVVSAILRRNPQERVLYLADQAHVPYGGRPLDEVRSFATGISEFLAAQGCRAIVMACNISSAVALPPVSKSLAPLSIFGMIRPAARRVAEGDSPRVGVLATEGTVRSGAYETEILRANPKAAVKQVACPTFVPLVEAGDTESEEAEAACREYLKPLAESGCEVVVLGCTHYPFLLPTLIRVSSEYWGRPVRFVDPAEEVAGEIPPAESYPVRREEPLTLLTTGDPTVFVDQVPRFLPVGDSRVGAARWTPDGRLVLAMAEQPLEGCIR